MNIRNLLLTLLLLLPVTMVAQERLSVSELFGKRFRDNVHVTEVKISNQERLMSYRLQYYHSLTVTDDVAVMDEVAEAFRKDLDAYAIEQEVSRVGDLIYSAFCQLPDDNWTGYHRYLFFKDMRLAQTDSQPKVLLIYMVGQADIPFLRSKFFR